MIKANIILIAGTGRSGSTLLEQLISRNIHCIAIGEVKYLWQRGFLRNELCACSKPGRECEFWHRVTDRAFGETFDPEAIEALRLKVERHRLVLFHRVLKRQSQEYESARAEYKDVLRKLYAAIQVENPTATIVDSSKDPAHIELVNSISSKAEILHLVRDSRAVVYSWQTPKLRKEIHWQEEYMPKIPVLRAVMDWIYINWVLEAVFRSATNIRRVHYEDLDEMHFGDLALGLSQEAVEPEDQILHSISGNPIRFDKIQKKFQLDERWKEKMPFMAKSIVTVLSAPFLWRYGYLKAKRRSST